MENDDLTTITSPGTSEAELAKAMRKVQDASVPPAFWTAIANDPRYTKPHRLRCIRRLFESYALPGIMLLELAEILRTPHWLQETDVYVIDEVGGTLPVRWTETDTVLCVRPFGWVLPLVDPAIYLRISGKLSAKDFVAVLRGEPTPKHVREARLLEVALLNSPDDRLT